MRRGKCPSFQNQNARCAIQRMDEGALRLGNPALRKHCISGTCGVHLIRQMVIPLPEARSWTTLDVKLLSYVHNLLLEISPIDETKG